MTNEDIRDLLSLMPRAVDSFWRRGSGPVQCDEGRRNASRAASTFALPLDDMKAARAFLRAHGKDGACYRLDPSPDEAAQSHEQRKKGFSVCEAPLKRFRRGDFRAREAFRSTNPVKSPAEPGISAASLLLGYMVYYMCPAHGTVNCSFSSLQSYVRPCAVSFSM
jgi:hypothetical protein